MTTPEQVTPAPTALDTLVAALAVLLMVLGAVLIVATDGPAPARVPIIAPAQLIAQHADIAQGV